ncbi:hypothetical protein [Pseudozobellia sp. WGM2]|uniref:hypothetical protein n=1 Tax=Pseudozobellia sp. WGM2 TaxID=2787625 RepID=UPI001ADEEB07|nr:hypothetical protein [Pseudozobellia sp. WGM2]
MTREELLLSSETQRFRNEHPETVKGWERQLAKGECGPDLHFCFYKLESYPNLTARLDAVEYRFDFAINAHILHAKLQGQFLEDGHVGPLALEHANEALSDIYRSLDEIDPEGRAAILKSLQ